MKRYFVGLTGASGHAYGLRLIQVLAASGAQVDVSITEAGSKVLAHELGLDAGPRGERLAQALAPRLSAELAARVRTFASDAIEAPAASGTALTGGAILCPCSMGTLARVSVGFSSNLVERAADVALKEGRPLVLVPREAPLSALHLENLLRLARLGAVILPAAPGFYHRPRGIDDLVDHIVGKVLDRLGVEHPLGLRWQGRLEPPAECGAELLPPRDPLAREELLWP